MRGTSQKRRNRSRQRSARIARARKQNRDQRPINEARPRLEQAREEEIAARKFRNHLRDMLFLFRGAPRASPFCIWVNDPREPEQLPPDWAPDEPMRQPLPDDPPIFRTSRSSPNLLRSAISPAIVPE